MASAVNALGDMHGGAGEQAMRFTGRTAPALTHRQAPPDLQPGVEVANFAETVQPDWTNAQANTISATYDLIVTLTVGSNSIIFTLAEPQLIEWPAPGDANGYRNIGLKFGGIPNSDQQTVMSIKFNS